MLDPSDGRLNELEAELTELEAQLADPATHADRRRFAELGRRHAQVTVLVDAARSFDAAVEDHAAALDLLASTEASDDHDEAAALVEAAEATVAEARDHLRTLLLPPDENEGRDVIVEIRGAEGGEEANLWARDLFEMYRAYASTHGWKVETMSVQQSDQGGVTGITFSVRGADAWQRLKFEGGPHRVQRVPATESQGRVHTSSATVAVLASADEVDVEIDPNDLVIDTYRSSGPGGQSVNTTDSAVRITHQPTGLVVSMQDEKSQIQNRAKAMAVLRSRLLAHYQQAQAAEVAEHRRSQVGGGGRSEKIRTYNYKDGRVTDHRIGVTLYKLDRVLAGELDELIDALLLDDRERQLSATHLDAETGP